MYQKTGATGRVATTPGPGAYDVRTERHGGFSMSGRTGGGDTF